MLLGNGIYFWTGSGVGTRRGRVVSTRGGATVGAWVGTPDAAGAAEEGVFPGSTVRLSNLGHPQVFGAGLDVEVVVGEEGLFFEGLADAGGGFGVGGGGEGAAEELQGIEVVGTLVELDGRGWRWGVEIGVDDGGEGGFALFFRLRQAVFEDGREWAEGGGEGDILNNFSSLRDGNGLGEAVGG